MVPRNRGEPCSRGPPKPSAQQSRNMHRRYTATARAAVCAGRITCKCSLSETTDVEHVRAGPGPGRGRAASGRRGVTRWPSGGHPLAVGTSPAADGVHERVDVLGRPGGHDRGIRAGGAPALPGRARLDEPPGCRDAALLTEPVALEADDHRLVLASPAGRLERLEVDGEVRLEVVLERA